MAVVGVVSNDGWVNLHDGPLPPFLLNSAGDVVGVKNENDQKHISLPLSLPLSLVLADMPKKMFNLYSAFVPTDAIAPTVSASNHLAHLVSVAAASNASPTTQIRNPLSCAISHALSRVLRLLDVGSKRFLTNKVDRSVGGLVAQQQCVGPLHTPLADVAVLALSEFGKTGVCVGVIHFYLKFICIFFIYLLLIN